MARRLLIGGHSHMVALAGPSSAAKPEVRTLPDDPEVRYLAGPWPRDAWYWEALRLASRDCVTAILFGGNEHNHFFLFGAARPFDFVPSRDPDAAVLDDAELVPEALIEERYAPTLEALGQALAHVTRNRSAASVAVVGTPPPKADEGFLREILTAEPDLVTRARDLGHDLAAVPITPYPVRYKLWQLLQDRFGEIAAGAGCAFLPVPPATYTAEGGLAREFWGGDASHANDAYGALMVRHLREALAA
ncbi:MAG: hypothetical protein JO048_04030 [Methylobacteriaceae bacterium]|nr:hypothetical protein [Methylobacteriaceae bacterium]